MKNNFTLQKNLLLIHSLKKQHHLTIHNEPDELRGGGIVDDGRLDGRPACPELAVTASVESPGQGIVDPGQGVLLPALLLLLGLLLT